MPRILIVEDENDIAILLKTVMEGEGFEAETTHDGSKALDKLEKDGFHLMTLDIFMPEMDGWQVLERVRKSEKTRKLPVVIFSILETQEAFRKSRDMGAVLVPKSSGEEKLLDEIKNLLSDRNK